MHVGSISGLDHFKGTLVPSTLDALKQLSEALMGETESRSYSTALQSKGEMGNQATPADLRTPAFASSSAVK